MSTLQSNSRTLASEFLYSYLSTLHIYINIITGSANITSMTNKVYGVVAGVSLPFPGYPSNMEKVCDLGISGGQCPIGVGASFTEEVKLPVTSVAPSVRRTF